MNCLPNCTRRLTGWPRRETHSWRLAASRRLKQRIAKGSGTPNTNKVGTVTRAQLEDIAKAKDPDLTAADMDAAVRTIAGSARSMGLEVEGL